MKKIMLKKSFRHLAPANPCDMVAFDKLKLDSVTEWQQVNSDRRNSKFNKKFHAMMRLGFDAWEPNIVKYKGVIIEKEYERFRKDITIIAGFHNGGAVNFRGEVRFEAKSLKFNSMGSEEFEKVYHACGKVLLMRVLKNYTDMVELDRVVNQLLGFS